MPQLDALSWFDQVFTSTIVFFVFYLLLSLFFLPALASIFKGRYKLTSFRKYVAEIFNLQANLFTLNTKNHLSILFFNNIFLELFFFLFSNFFSFFLSSIKTTQMFSSFIFIKDNSYFLFFLLIFLYILIHIFIIFK